MEIDKFLDKNVNFTLEVLQYQPHLFIGMGLFAFNEERFRRVSNEYECFLCDSSILLQKKLRLRRTGSDDFNEERKENCEQSSESNLILKNVSKINGKVQNCQETNWLPDLSNIDSIEDYNCKKLRIFKESPLFWNKLLCFFELEAKRTSSKISCQSCLLALTGKPNSKPINMVVFCKRIFQLVSDWNNTTKPNVVIPYVDSWVCDFKQKNNREMVHFTITSSDLSMKTSVKELMVEFLKKTASTTYKLEANEVFYNHLVAEPTLDYLQFHDSIKDVDNLTNYCEINKISHDQLKRDADLQKVVEKGNLMLKSSPVQSTLKSNENSSDKIIVIADSEERNIDSANQSSNKQNQVENADDEMIVEEIYLESEDECEVAENCHHNSEPTTNLDNVELPQPKTKDGEVNENTETSIKKCSPTSADSSESNGATSNQSNGALDSEVQIIIQNQSSSEQGSEVNENTETHIKKYSPTSTGPIYVQLLNTFRGHLISINKLSDLQRFKFKSESSPKTWNEICIGDLFYCRYLENVCKALVIEKPQDYSFPEEKLLMKLKEIETSNKPKDLRGKRKQCSNTASGPSKEKRKRPSNTTIDLTSVSSKEHDSDDNIEGSVFIRYKRDNEECEIKYLNHLRTLDGNKFQSFDELKINDEVMAWDERNQIAYKAIIIAELTPKGKGMRNRKSTLKYDDFFHTIVKRYRKSY